MKRKTFLTWGVGVFLLVVGVLFFFIQPTLYKSLQVAPIIGVMEKAVDDVEFFGQILDQNGHKVAGVEVNYSALGSYGGYKGGAGNAVTDADGIFHVTDLEGTSLRIYQATKAGYQIPLFPQTNRFFPSKKVNQQKTMYEYTRDRPCIFRAWKYTRTVNPRELMHRQFGKKLIADSSPCAIDFFGNRKTTAMDGYDPAKMNMRMRFTDGEDAWSLVIESEEIGLMKPDGILTNEAPESKYVEKITLTNNDATRVYDEYRMSIFVHLKERNIFGRVAFSIMPFINSNDAVIRGFYALNMSGERILDTYDGPPR